LLCNHELSFAHELRLLAHDALRAHGQFINKKVGHIILGFCPYDVSNCFYITAGGFYNEKTENDGT